MTTERIKFLEKEILKHKQYYYSGNAVIPDAVYDFMEDELRSLCPDSPILEVVGIPTEEELEEILNRIG